MTITATEYIPAEKFAQFHEILVATGGRYLRKPFPLWSHVEVHYEFGDYVAHQQAWMRCTTQIREVRRDQWWRKIMRRCGLLA